MDSTISSIKDWEIDVKFQASGALLATATGVLLVPPQDALAFVTDEAGDKLFRVVQRKALPNGPQGGRCVEVVNKAAIRVLAWKLWSTSNVIYEIQRRPSKAGTLNIPQQLRLPGLAREHEQERVTFELVSSSMLQSLTGTWTLQPIRVHHTALPQHMLTAAAAHAPDGSSYTNTKLTQLQCSTPSCSSPRSRISIGSLLSPRCKTSSSCNSPFANPFPSNNNNSSSSSSSSSKASFIQKLALLSPRGRTTSGSAPASPRAQPPASPKATAAGGALRPPVVITARTSSGVSSEMSSSVTGGMSGGSILAGGGWCGSSVDGCSSKAAMAAGPLLPPGLLTDAEGYLTATYVHYEQLAQPKGMPPGVRCVPGLSTAVAASVGREVRQMLEKVSCVSDAAVGRGLRPQAALSFVVEQMEQAGGSFKSLQKQLRKQQQQILKHIPHGSFAAGSGTAAVAGTGRSSPDYITLLSADTSADATAIATAAVPAGFNVTTLSLMPVAAVELLSLKDKQAGAGSAAAAAPKQLLSHPVDDFAEFFED